MNGLITFVKYKCIISRQKKDVNGDPLTPHSPDFYAPEESMTTVSLNTPPSVRRDRAPPCFSAIR